MAKNVAEATPDDNGLFGVAGPNEVEIPIIGLEAVAYESKKFNQYRLKSVRPVESVPTAGFIGALAKTEPVMSLRIALAQALDVPAECLSIAADGKDLADDLTIKDNDMLEPGPAARRSGVRLEIVFDLGDAVPGAVRRRKESEAREKQFIVDEEKRVKEERAREEAARRKVLEEAKRKEAEETQRRDAEAQRALQPAAGGARAQVARHYAAGPAAPGVRIFLRCYEVGSAAGAGFLVRMPSNGSVGQLAGKLVQQLGLQGGDVGVTLVFGAEGRPMDARHTLEHAGIACGARVMYYFDDSAEKTAVAEHDRNLEIFAFETEAEAVACEGRCRATEFLADFHQTSGWPIKPPSDEEQEVLQLCPRQIQGLAHVRGRCKPLHHEALQAQIRRAEGLGFTELDFVRTLEWVREQAPIIVHVDLAEFGARIAQDKHYRNQFETNISRGGLNHQRMTEVEDTLFGRAYRQAEPSERVKYGVLNFTNNVRGVSACHKTYGQDYLVLQRVRLRTTMCSDDSWVQTPVGTPDYYAHILGDYSDEDFAAALRWGTRGKGGGEGAKAAPDAAASSGPEDRKVGEAKEVYREVQVHGELRLRDHVAKIVVSEAHDKSDGALCAMLEQLQKACADCDLLWVADVESHPKIAAFPTSLRELKPP